MIYDQVSSNLGKGVGFAKAIWQTTISARHQEQGIVSTGALRGVWGCGSQVRSALVKWATLGPVNSHLRRAIVPEKYLGKAELRMGFALPGLYLRMERDGVLHHGKDREDWLKNWHRGHWETRVRLVKPPALSCTLGEYSVYWEPPAEVGQWDPPEYWKDSGPASFARNGYGDCWCWYSELADSFGTPVAFCPQCSWAAVWLRHNPVWSRRFGSCTSCPVSRSWTNTF